MPVFTVEQRDALRERVLGIGKQDERVVAGAVVGSLAVDSGDRFSDLDLTFGIADRVMTGDMRRRRTGVLVPMFAGLMLLAPACGSDD